MYSVWAGHLLFQRHLEMKEYTRIIFSIQTPKNPKPLNGWESETLSPKVPFHN